MFALELRTFPSTLNAFVLMPFAFRGATAYVVLLRIGLTIRHTPNDDTNSV
jgi:hypothetical protein